MFVRVLLFLWELPQNVLGILTLAVERIAGNIIRIEEKEGRYLIELRGEGGVSLGIFIFHSKRDSKYVPMGLENRDHEFAHAVQSRMFGPLYLLVVGLPSVMRVFYAMAHRRIHGRRWGGYYDGWPENAADRLGGVDKSLRPDP